MRTPVQSDEVIRRRDLLSLIAHPTEVLTRSNDQHRRLVMLLGSGDADGAVRLLRGHIEGTEHIIAGLLPGSQPA